ncbi:MAG: hypothetical protein CMJ79_03730 [Planctomycetaceae bacterium]|nr:hypothetical protein [Planctomycetaceae bacterium]|tara:strand:+ start:4799 stop:5947 length:1149 start_codon:yes stop_codon:yes gene_type:complete
MKLSKFALLGAFAFAVMTGSVSADELQQPVLEPIAYTLQDAADSPSDDGTWSLFKRDGEGLEISGWTQVGYHDRNTGLYGAPSAFNTDSKKVGVHQVWFAFDKASNADAEGLGLGYHFDLVYGRDAENTNAFGNPNAGAAGDWDTEADDWAMPQLYLTGHLGDWEITAGKFFTLVGYEVVTAPNNFFYSRARTMNNSEPFTHTGVLASKTTETGLDLTVGWTAGWDTGFDSNGSNGIVALGKSLGDNIGLNYVTTFGDISETENGYTHSIVMDITLGERMSYVFQTDYVDTTTRYEVSVNQYVFYTLSDDVAVGARLEWWRNSGANSTGTLGGDSVYSLTAGVNWRPQSSFDLVLRPEIRTDWDATTDNTRSGFGIDAILSY